MTSVTLVIFVVVALVFDVSNETHMFNLPSHVSYKIRMDADRVDTTDRVLDQ
jgi:hypothetical protein